MKSGLLISVIAAAFAMLVGGDAVRTGGNTWRATEFIMYVGTYTRPPSKGIYCCRLDPATGEARLIGLAAETQNPSFLAIHPNQRFLYAVNETPAYLSEPTGSVSAFAIDTTTGQLKLLNQVSSKGPGPCHIAVDRDGKWVFVANYDGGSIAAFPVRQNGSLGEASTFIQHQGSSVNRERQAGPHAHAATLSPDNRFVMVADLGLDQILSYPLDPAAGLRGDNTADAKPGRTNLAPGSGPRHIAFRPDGRFVYVINEMLSTVTAFGYKAGNASMHEAMTLSTLPPGFRGNNSTAEIAVHPSGRFLYGSNRGHDSIAIFRIDPATGAMGAAGHVSTRGRTPRNFAIDPTGRYLLAANQDSNNVVVFRIDPETGGLSPAGTVLEIPSPVCLSFAAPK